MQSDHLREMQNAIKEDYAAKIQRLESQILKLKEARDKELQALKVLAHRLPSQKTRDSREPAKTVELHQAKTTIKELVLTAAKRFNDGFTTEELLEKLNSDQGSADKIKESTFISIFSRLKADKHIIATEQPSGNKRGRYKFNQQINTPKELL